MRRSSLCKLSLRELKISKFLLSGETWLNCQILLSKRIILDLILLKTVSYSTVSLSSLLASHLLLKYWFGFNISLNWHRLSYFIWVFYHKGPYIIWLYINRRIHACYNPCTEMESREISREVLFLNLFPWNILVETKDYAAVDLSAWGVWLIFGLIIFVMI